MWSIHTWHLDERSSEIAIESNTTQEPVNHQYFPTSRLHAFTALLLLSHLLPPLLLLLLPLSPPLLFMSTPFPPPSLPISTSTSAAGVGLGYGIAIAVGLLVLISTILLASYLCVRSKSPLPVPSSSPLPPAPSSPPHFIIGLDVHTIDAFYPKFVHQSEGGNKNASGDDALSGPCPICLGEYESGDVLRQGPDCGHCFHAACVDEWLRLSATCPLCRSSPVPSPVATPLSELIPLARSRGR